MFYIVNTLKDIDFEDLVVAKTRDVLSSSYAKKVHCYIFLTQPNFMGYSLPSSSNGAMPRTADWIPVVLICSGNPASCKT